MASWPFGPCIYVHTCTCTHELKWIYRCACMVVFTWHSLQDARTWKKSSNFQVYQWYWGISRPKTLTCQHNVRTCILRYQKVDLAKASTLRPQSQFCGHYSWRYRPPKIVVEQFQWSPPFYSRGKKNLVGSKSVIGNYYPLKDGFQNFVSLGAWEQFHVETSNYRCLAQILIQYNVIYHFTRHLNILSA